MNGLGTLLSKLILRYFSFYQLQTLKFVSKYWYAECKTSYLMQFSQLKMDKMDDIRRYKSLYKFLCSPNSFCQVHKGTQCVKATNPCYHCHIVTCTYYKASHYSIIECFRCRERKVCGICKTLVSDWIECAGCEKFLCKKCDTTHGRRLCKGIGCYHKKAVCGGAICCKACMKEGIYLCHSCKKHEVCIYKCLDHSGIYLCYKCYDLKNNDSDDSYETIECPLCQNPCPTCRSYSCNLCGEFVCTTDSNKGVCKLLRFGETLACLPCLREKISDYELPNKRPRRKCKNKITYK